MWLLGYEFSDTVFILTKNQKFIILTSTKKASYLEGLKNTDVNLVIISKTKEDNKIKEAIQYITSSGAGKRIGMIIKETPQGKFASEFSEALQQASFEIHDATFGLAFCMVSKEPSELKDIEMASKISATIMQNFFLDEMGSIIDEDRKVTHLALSTKIEEVLGDHAQKWAKKLKFPAEVDVQNLEFAYLPSIQSGGEYDLRHLAESSQQTLHAGTIICMLGVRYKTYCSNLARTFLINPSKSQEKNYDFLVELYRFVLDQLKPGVKGKDIYHRALRIIKEKRPDLEPHFIKSLGCSIGIEFRDTLISLSPKNELEIPVNTVLNICVGFQQLKNDTANDERGKVYAYYIADTVVVEQDKVTCLTSKSTIDPSNVCFYFEEEDEVDDSDDNNNGKEKEAETFKKKQPNGNTVSSLSDRSGKKGDPIVESRKNTTAMATSSSTSGTLDLHSSKRPERRKASSILQTKTRYEDREQSAEAKRQAHQKELAQQRQAEGLRRFTEQNEKSQKENARVLRKFESYKTMYMLPKDAGLQIYVDHRNESIVLPMFGFSVPFHIATLKNLSKNDEGEYVYIRLNFVTPGQTVGRKEEMPFDDNDQVSLVKTLTYRSTDVARMTDIYRQISELKKQSLKAEAERKDKADIVEQDQLIEMKKSRPVTLQDVYARPTLDGKRLPGDLQIHVNGLRYLSRVKSENRIDILYSNIRHLFFQPCDKELIVLIHLHLKNPIMIGKKKTKDLQFYKEAIDVSFDETGNRKRRQTYGDEDELQQEQEEKRRRIRLNKEFKEFGEKVAESYEGRLDLDIPFRDLAFDGVPFRANVLLQPTAECLVHLTDPPFLVITISDLELVHLERVHFGLKNFDMVFIFSDFNRTPVHINSIPMKELESVKDWLEYVIIILLSKS
ncbi:FACT complex subunit spt16 [Coelomomyces lativittatus]|nr:FACT complex subunit spt16 [Coelomomyces lativittatus]